MVYCRRLSLWTLVRCLCLSILAVVIYKGSKSHSANRKTKNLELTVKKPENYVYIKEYQPQRLHPKDNNQQENVHEIIGITVKPIVKPEHHYSKPNQTIKNVIPKKIPSSNQTLQVKKIYSVHSKNITKGLKPEALKSKVIEKTTKKPVKVRKVVSPGENVQVDNLDIFINTAVYYERYPSNNSYNVIFNGWAGSSSTTNLKCCFTSQEEGGQFHETQAQVRHIYKQYIVDMQSAEFYCTLPDKVHTVNLTLVTFVQQSCKKSDVNRLMKIEKPRLYPGVIGVCLKVAYGSLNAEKIVEWFEYMRYMGIPKVFSYYSQVEAPGMKVFNYYKTLGFLDMLPIYPAQSKNGTERNFIKPKNFKQYWVDNVVALNGCKHRMSGFDYVLTLSIDQFIFPKGKVQSFPDIVQELMKREPKAGAFMFDQHIAVMNWNTSRKSPLHVSKYLIRTKSLNYGNNLTATPGWVYIPRRTFYIGRDTVYPMATFKTAKVPNELYTMLQYRVCDKYWPRCQNESKIAEHGMLKYEIKLVDRILKLPLQQILSSNLNYVNYMISWRRKHHI
ncbi:uncharacterized protein LOC106063664 isoform X2 [Biomphalaria glabrata]|nr:uncharacterized protein LOC106063664 isoform X2 [Biomphalaria glabrata]XP_055872611.1 uncharacterized protein LOC106063664 isoform X2 [Biomphalaria glabrata]XP_055872612.1 uncharacterized protein LOC106063664 isoform X2 [Biomphalaria glabrata]XP_055872613.1 uncharacterized protein LOC106063664 isoform X2 [Biomphalaria glabrata]KAI8752284.1 anaphase-promoting complex subunit cdh1-like [Biomphalaria glabrata]